MNEIDPQKFDDTVFGSNPAIVEVMNDILSSPNKTQMAIMSFANDLMCLAACPTIFFEQMLESDEAAFRMQNPLVKHILNDKNVSPVFQDILGEANRIAKDKREQCRAAIKTMIELRGMILTALIKNGAKPNADALAAIMKEHKEEEEC